MFKGLKEKLFGNEEEDFKEQIEVIVEQKEVVEEVHIEEVYEKTSNDLQNESIDIEQITEEEFLDLTTTREIQANYDEVISKLDEVVELVEEKTTVMNTYEALQEESNLVVEDIELNILEENTAEINNFMHDSKEMLIAESDEIKKNSDTVLINKGMFDLNSQLHNAKFIIEDTEIPEAVTKEEVLNSKTRINN